MKKIIVRLSFATALGALAIGPVPVLAAQHSVTHNAKLSMQQARKIALDAYPGGRIVKGELEHERGGSGLRYSFDMRHGRSWREVGVDAMTGKVLENSAQGANPKD